MPFTRGFLDERRLIKGPWQAFERDVARLLIANGFVDVRLVAGAGDHGGDVLGVKNGELWIVQCKHTYSTPPPTDAVREVVEAARFYKADHMVLATSRPASDALLAEKARYERTGLRIILAEPATLLRWMMKAPEYARSRKKLRVYQEEVSDRFREGLLDTGRAQIALATGLGKTVIMAEVVADLLRDGLLRSGRAIVIAHTVELVQQLHRSFWYQLPKWMPTHQLSEGEDPSHWDGTTFATVQSVLARAEHLPRFDLVLVDEAHHIGSETYRRVLQLLAPQMLGGVTATPWRGDDFDIDLLLGPPLVRIGIAEGLREGFLSDVDYRLLGDNLDWKLVQRASRHKYSISQLNKRLILPTRDEEAARIMREVFDAEERHSGVVFSPTIVHAEGFAAVLRRYGFRAEAISSDSSPRERDMLMSRFRAGQLDLATTVDLFNEGVDLPDVDLIVFMRVTHSRRIFVQQLGRGLRMSPNKDRVVVLDFVTDLRRVAEVVELDQALRAGEVERLGLGRRLIQFTDMSAGGFLKEWMMDQASLLLREGDAGLMLPRLQFPKPPPPGGVQ